MRESALRGGQTLFFDRFLLADGWSTGVRLEIAGGCVAAIESGCRPQSGDERHRCGLPALPNLHSHAFQRGMAGLAERRGACDDGFWTWREVMYRFLDGMTPDDLRVIATLAYVEMLESGFGRVGEFHYLHHDPDGHRYADIAETSGAIIDAAGDAGIGLTLLPVLYSHAGFGARPPEAAQRRFILDLDGYHKLLTAADARACALPDAVVGLAPHSLRAVAPGQLSSLMRIAGARPIHIHIAEQRREVEDCVEWSGRRPVEWLLDHVAVDARWCLVHATHMTAAETLSVARSGAVTGLCPITEANLGDGLFPLEGFLDAGGRYGIGSDSNVLIDGTEELRMLEYGQRLTLGKRNVGARRAGRWTGADLYSGAVTGGAQALGCQGGIAIGRPADIVSLDIDHPSLTHRDGDAMIDGFVFAAGRGAVDCVWRRGARLVTGGRHRGRDRAVRDYRAAIARLLAT